jgi:hypothetical protein
VVRKYTGSVVPIAKDDYFLKNPEFCVWLVESRGKYFGELESEEARSDFGAFVEEWNGNRLDAKFYEGAVSDGGVKVPRTRPANQVVNQLKIREGEIRNRRTFLLDKREREHASRDDQRRRGREDRRKRNREGKELLEEMFPRATGRDALREKKAGQRDFHRERERSPDFDVAQADLMGANNNSFAEAVQRQNAKKEAFRSKKEIKRLEMEEKLVQYKAAEDEKLNQFRALIQAGPIKIKKRTE